MEKASDLRPDILALSGDLAWQGKRAGYDLLHEWLQSQLFPTTGLGPNHCILRAGNHDIERDKVLEIESPGAVDWADLVLRTERMGKGCWLGFPGFRAFRQGNSLLCRQ